MKKIISAVLVALLTLGVLAFAGCGYTEIDEEALGNKVLAVVNGENILRKEWSQVYSYYEYMYINYYGYTKEKNAEAFEKLRTQVLDSLINQKIWEQKAKAAGFFEYTQEQRDEARKEVEEEMNKSIEDTAKTLYEAVKGQEGAKEMDYYRGLAKEQYEANLAKNGSSVDKMIEDKLKEKALNRYKEDNLKDVSVLEADIISAYNELVKKQTEDFIGDGDEKAYDKFVKAWNNGDNMALILDGYSLVQHILIKYDKETGDKVTSTAKTLSEAESAKNTAQEKMDKLKKELAELTDETKKADKQKEIDEQDKVLEECTAKYNDAKLEHHKAREAAEAAIREKAQEVLNSVKDADEAKFIEVMLDKSEDTGMADEETAKKGYLVGKEDGMMSEFHDGAVALEKDGQISDLVATDYGFHIIRRIKALEERTGDNKVSYEELKEALQKELTDTAKNEKWTKNQEDRRKAANVKINKQWLKDYDT